MHLLSRLVLLSFLLASPHATATPADALRIQKTYQLAMEKWALETRIAATPAEQTQAWGNRPDAVVFAKQMWAGIGQSLDQEWTLEPAAWFLQITPGLFANNEAGVPTAVFTKENEAIRKAVETQHINSLKLIPVCVALASSSDPRSLSLLEKIQSGNPDSKTQGVAAFGAALQLKTLGDDGEIMRKRLTFLRKAIIQSSDVELNGVAIPQGSIVMLRLDSSGRDEAVFAEAERFDIAVLDPEGFEPDRPASAVDGEGALDRVHVADRRVGGAGGLDEGIAEAAEQRVLGGAVGPDRQPAATL